MSETRRRNQRPTVRVSSAFLDLPADYDFDAPGFFGDEPDPLVRVHHRGMPGGEFLGDEVLVSFGMRNSLDTVALKGTLPVLRQMIATTVALLDAAADAMREGTDR